MSLMLVLIHALLVLTTAAAAQQTGTISGRVVDRESLKPISQVAVSIRGTERRTLTDAEGAFRLTAVPLGERFLVVTHIAYGEYAESVVVPGDRVLQLQVLLSRQAIQLTPLVLEAPTELERRRRTSGNAFNEILRVEVEDAARRGLDLGRLLRDGMPGIRVNAVGRQGTSYCVEYRLSGAPRETCRAVSVYLDGVQVSAPSSLYSTLPLEQIERLELLSPSEAGARYGSAGGFGVLLIETRQGPRVARAGTRERLVPGFDWSLEQQPYRWTRVLGASLVGSAVGLGVGLLVADQCLRVSAGTAMLRSRCGPLATMGSGFITVALPGVAGSVAAQWAGSTQRSQGRIVPSALLGTLAVAAGYLLLVQGEGADSDAARTAGAIVLTIGAPLILTLGDRAFRALR